MIKYKIDIIKELKNKGVNTTVAKASGVFGQATMKKFKEGDTNISLDNINRLCCILGLQPGDIIGYSETECDKEKIISKVSDEKC